MILDSLKNSALYYGVSPRMKQAFELIASTDWTTMEPGIHELDGKDIYVNVMEQVHPILPGIRGKIEPVAYTLQASFPHIISKHRPGDPCSNGIRSPQHTVSAANQSIQNIECRHRTPSFRAHIITHIGTKVNNANRDV